MFFACQSSVFESPWSTELQSTAPTCLFGSIWGIQVGIWNRGDLEGERQPVFFLWWMQGDVDTSVP